MDSCSSLLWSVPKSKYWNTPRSQIQSACPCQAQIELWMLWFWSWDHIKFPDSQLASKALTYFNATNVSMVEDRMYISEPKSLDMPFSCLSLKSRKYTKFWICGSLSWFKTFKKKSVMIFRKQIFVICIQCF